MQPPLLQTLDRVRSFGGVVFIIGALAMAWQVVPGAFKPGSGRAFSWTDAVC